MNMEYNQPRGRNAKGQFIPREMTAIEAHDKGLGYEYQFSKNYKNDPTKAVATRIKDNPNEFQPRVPREDKIHTKTGVVPPLAPVYVLLSGVKKT
jgi:hypothetical protein